MVSTAGRAETLMEMRFRLFALGLDEMRDTVSPSCPPGFIPNTLLNLRESFEKHSFSSASLARRGDPFTIRMEGLQITIRR